MILGSLVSLTGFIVLCGWKFGIPELTSIKEDWVTMKVLTAVGFLVAGLLLATIRSKNGKIEIIHATLSHLLIVVIFGMMLGALGVINLDYVSGFPDTSLLYSDGANVPSLSTIVCFFTMAIVGFIPRARAYYSASIVLITTSIIALLGYKFDLPYLYFYIPEISTGMAIHTAILFGMLGFGYLNEAMKRITT